MKTFSAALLAIGLALIPCFVARAAPSAEVEASAAAHFERGVEFYRDGSLDAALVEFERAYELIPNYRLLFNLAQIQAERHEYAAAISFFEKYLQTGASEIPEARRVEAERELAKLRIRVAHLWVESDVAGAQLFVNDEPVAVLPLSEPVAINPGVCNLRLEKAGYLPTTHSLKAAGGEQPRLRLSLVEASGGGASDARSQASDAVRGNYTPFWVSAASTAAFGVATLAFGLTARNADRDLDTALDQFPADQNQIEDARSRLKLYSALTDSCAALSVVGLGLAIYFLAKPPKTSSHSAKETALRSLRILPGHRGVAVRANF